MQPADGRPTSIKTASRPSRLNLRLTSQGVQTYAQFVDRAQEIREQIAGLQRELCEVLTQQNALLPVHRLPDEVFVEVFAYFVPRLGRGIHFTDLVRATHVCRWWRDVAVSTPALWTTLSTTNKTLMDTFLFRARSMNISVFVPYRRDLGLINPYIHRLCRLFIDTPTPPILDPWWFVGERDSEDEDEDEGDEADEETDVALVAHLPSPAPFLKELWLYGGTGNLVTDDLFASSAPALRILHLEMMFDPESICCLTQNLQELSFNHLDAKIPLENVCAILQHCPQLEKLVISHYDPHCISTGPKHKVAQLPRLAWMHVSSTTPIVWTTLLRHVVLPETVFLYYEQHVSQWRFRSFSAAPLIPSLDGFTPPIPDLRSLVCKTQSHPSGSELSLWGFITGSIHPSLHLKLLNFDMRLNQPGLWDIYPLHQLESFHLVDATAHTELSLDWWTGSLMRMTALETLHITRPAGDSSLLLLLGALTGPRLCPALRTLVLDFVTDTPGFRAFMAPIVNAMKARGVPLRTIRLHRTASEGVELTLPEVVLDELGDWYQGSGRAKLW